MLHRAKDSARVTHDHPEGIKGAQATAASLESSDFETAVRLAVSLGGDCDTLAYIAGGIAAAFYGGVPGPIREQALARLDEPLAAIVLEIRGALPRGGETGLASHRWKHAGARSPSRQLG